MISYGRIGTQLRLSVEERFFVSFKEDVEFLKQDICEETPQGQFHLIFCRNLAFTYFEDSLQKEILQRILTRLKDGGFFIIGKKESLPDTKAELLAWGELDCIFQKKGDELG